MGLVMNSVSLRRMVSKGQLLWLVENCISREKISYLVVVYLSPPFQH